MRSIRLASLLAVLLPVSALAVPVTYEFTGTLTSYQTDGDITDNPFPYGTEFFGSFTLEDSTVPFTDIGFTGYLDAVTAASISFGSGGSLGSFQHTGSLLEFSVYSSNLVFLNDFEYMGNPPVDQFSLGISLGTLPGDPVGAYRSFDIALGGSDTSLLPAGLSITDPLPTAKLIEQGLSLNFYYSVFDADGNSVEFKAPGGLIASLTQVPVSVPEPSTLALFAAGVLGLALRRRSAA